MKKKLISLKNILRLLRNTLSLYIYGRNILKIKGKNNIVKRNLSSFFYDTKIKIIGNNNKIIFGKNCEITSLRILVLGNNNLIKIGNNVVVNASAGQPTIINSRENSIIIEDGCMLSNNIEIHNTDYHYIVDDNNNILNPEKSIIIHKNVWIGLRTVILKGTEISENCVIGACSLLSGKYLHSNCVIAGNPAKTIKNNIYWKK